MKIVFNTDQIYLHGGIEKVMATKVNYWANIPNVEVFIVTTEQQGNLPCYALDPRIQLLDLGINYNRKKSYFSKENLQKAIQHYKKQKVCIAQLQPDVIISPNFNFDHYWLPFIKGNSKLIKERHSSRYLEPEQRKMASFLGRLKYKLTDWIESKYHHIVVLNADEAKYVQTGNAVVIPNPINLNLDKAELNNKCVIAAGRIHPVKGFDHLIEAWKIIHNQALEWQLHIYGENYGTTQQELEELIAKYQLQNVIQFKGAINNIPKQMLNYSIYTLTSKTECFPTALLEALSVGLPIVTYDCPHGPKNIVIPEVDGFIIKNDNINEFANYVLKLIRDKDLRIKMGENAKNNYKRFSVEEVMEKWNTLFNKQING